MNKAILTIASMFVMMVLGSAMVPVGTAPAIGYKAPDVTVASASDNHNLRSMAEGKPMLLTFWSTTDASSRVACAEYDRMMSRNSDWNEQITFVALNLDRSAGVYRLSVERDNLIHGSHMHPDSASARQLIEEFDLSEGCKTFLIDGDGIITAVNPDETTIARMLNT